MLKCIEQGTGKLLKYIVSVSAELVVLGMFLPSSHSHESAITMGVSVSTAVLITEVVSLIKCPMHQNP